MTARPAGIEPADVEPGVAWAYEFDEQGRGHSLPIDAPVDLMHGPRFVWLHLILANARSRQWIGSQDAVVPEARERILSQDGHPRIEWRGEVLWGTLHDIQREFESLGEDAADLRFVLTPKFLLTARRHPVFCAATVRRQIDAGAEFGTSSALFESMLVAMADSIGEAAHQIGAKLDTIEDRVLSESFSDERGSLLKLRRAVSRQNRLAHAAFSVLQQLELRRADSPSPAYQDLAARVRQRVASFHADLHLQGERARLLQEEMSAQLASATNRNLFVLTIVTTVLLPPAFVTGFFGMNTKGLPFADSDNGSLYAAALCCLAAGLVYLLIRRYRIPS